MLQRSAAAMARGSCASAMATTSQRSSSTYPGTFSCAMLPAPMTPNLTRSMALQRPVLLQLDRVAGRVGHPDLHHVTLRAPHVLDALPVELVDCSIDVVDRDTEV